MTARIYFLLGVFQTSRDKETVSALIFNSSYIRNWQFENSFSIRRRSVWWELIGQDLLRAIFHIRFHFSLSTISNGCWVSMIHSIMASSRVMVAVGSAPFFEVTPKELRLGWKLSGAGADIPLCKHETSSRQDSTTCTV